VEAFDLETNSVFHVLEIDFVLNRINMTSREHGYARRTLDKISLIFKEGDPKIQGSTCPDCLGTNTRLTNDTPIQCLDCGHTFL
jgi:hypothetical protein